MSRCDEWESHELQVLYDLVNTVDWLKTAERLLTRRTSNAIQTRMSNLRAEAGIVPGIIGPRAIANSHARRDAASAASERLRQAIVALEAA
jgi:hypothetical protein